MSVKVYNMMEDAEYRISRTAEFTEWFETQDVRAKAQISGRIEKIKLCGHFGDYKSVSFSEKGILKNAVWELRWKDGRRLYYAYIPEKRILLILGGSKNGQDKDISKAKSIYLKATKITQKKR